MKIIDISWPLTENTTGYKNRKNIAIIPTRTFEKDGWRETNITVEAHTGTHVDAPLHFMRNGNTIDQIPLEQLIGQATVLDLTHCAEHITRADLELLADQIKQDEIILLKTANSSAAPDELFRPNFVYLHESGARYLQEKKVKAVGIDYLGIERGQPGHETHLALMQHNIAIIEGLRLHHVAAGVYTCICLPLHVVGIEAAPARAILIDAIQ